MTQYPTPRQKEILDLLKSYDLIWEHNRKYPNDTKAYPFSRQKYDILEQEHDSLSPSE